MTAKRFKIEEIEEELYPMPIYYDGDKELQYDEVCELLNELHEENQRLQEENKELEKFRYYIFKRMSQIYEDKE